MQFRYLTLIVILLVCCAPKTPQVNLKNIDTDGILKKIQAGSDKRVTLKGIARVIARNKFEKISVRQVTVLGKNSSFHLETLAIFGQSIAALTSDGKQAVLLTRSDKTVFEEIENVSLSYFYPSVPPVIKVTELIDLLFGKVPFGLWSKDRRPFIEHKNNALTATYVNSRGSETVLYINPESGQVTSAEIEIGAGGPLHIEYSDYTNVTGVLFPRKIKLSYLSNELQINYEKDLILNKQTDIKLLAR